MSARHARAGDAAAAVLSDDGRVIELAAYPGDREEPAEGAPWRLTPAAARALVADLQTALALHDARYRPRQGALDLP